MRIIGSVIVNSVVKGIYTVFFLFILSKFFKSKVSIVYEL